ncbi:Uncharacterized protein GBIM_15694 [Gryllus bimaculatus]|nr:Uncharacterized protein GBIM_15694 [Gryllus bimaculatus]
MRPGVIFVAFSRSGSPRRTRPPRFTGLPYLYPTPYVDAGVQVAVVRLTVPVGLRSGLRNQYTSHRRRRGRRGRRRAGSLLSPSSPPAGRRGDWRRARPRTTASRSELNAPPERSRSLENPKTTSSSRLAHDENPQPSRDDARRRRPRRRPAHGAQRPRGARALPAAPAPQAVGGVRALRVHHRGERHVECEAPPASGLPAPEKQLGLPSSPGAVARKAKQRRQAAAAAAAAASSSSASAPAHRFARRRHQSSPVDGEPAARPQLSASSISLSPHQLSGDYADDVFDDIPPPPPPPCCNPRNGTTADGNSPLERLEREELVALWRSSESELRSHLLKAIRAKEVTDPP